MDELLGPSSRPSKEAFLTEFIRRRERELAPARFDNDEAPRKKVRIDSNASTATEEPKRPATDKPIPLTTQSLSSLKASRRSSSKAVHVSAQSPDSSLSSLPCCEDNETSKAPPPLNSTISRTTPTWYKTLGTRHMQSNLHVSLKVKLEQTRVCIKQAAEGNLLSACFEKLRSQLHQMLYLHTTGLRPHHWPATVKASGILNDNGGLPRIFDRELSALDGVDYPWDIRADAQEVYNKWARGDFEINLLRGIIIKTVGNRSSDSIDANAKTPWNYFGGGNLVNGQWWPTQLATVRDGAHGSAQGGIAGIKADRKRGECGAVSIVLAGGYSDDRDEGDEIWYTGTEGAGAAPTESTMRLRESVAWYVVDKGRVKNPVRVIRSHKLGAKSRYAPKKGFRYDGLYDVLGWKVLDEEKQIHLFHLTRRAGQDPIRAIGVEARPTDEEIAAYNKLREVNKDFM